VNDLENYNVVPLFIPYKNRWTLYYFTIKPILKDEELSISYGRDYWNTRDKLARNIAINKNKDQE
jgi:hypothetical protein